MKPVVVAVALALAATSAIVWAVWPQETPDYAWEKIRSASCTANVDDFYARVNWNAISQSIMARKPNETDATMEKGRKMFENDIRLGTASKFCLAKKTSSDVQAQTINVTWGDNVELHMKFALAGDKYVLVDLDTAMPSSTEVASAEVPSAAPRDEKAVPFVMDRLLKTSSLSVAFDILKPQMKDPIRERDEAVHLLGLWSTKFMTWEGLNALGETTRAKAMKDTDIERGSRLCSSGMIMEISADRSSKTPMYTGTMIDTGGNRLSFLAVRSTGNLVERSPARICGIVTGQSTLTVHVVGMFDLPENRKAVADEPLAP